MWPEQQLENQHLAFLRLNKTSVYICRHTWTCSYFMSSWSGWEGCLRKFEPRFRWQFILRPIISYWLPENFPGNHIKVDTNCKKHMGNKLSKHPCICFTIWEEKLHSWRGFTRTCLAGMGKWQDQLFYGSILLKCVNYDLKTVPCEIKNVNF